MKFGPDAIAADGRYGMPKNHMEAMQHAAKEIGPIGVRPVSKFARTFIEEGCPTKPFAVKNKSANTGIAAGLIPINPLYGRVLSHDYGKHSKQLDDAYHKDPNLKPIPLILNESRLLELASLFEGTNNQISIIEKSNNSPRSFDISWVKEGKEIKVHAIQNKDGNFAIIDDNNSAIQVLGKAVHDRFGNTFDRPITADYDLLVVCPSYSDFEPEGKDKAPFRTQGLLASSEKENITNVMESTKPDYVGPHESKIGGNWNQRVEDAVGTINNYIRANDENRKGTGLQTVHHNAEFHNPFADDLKNNVPCLMVLPCEMDLSSIQNSVDAKHATIILIENVEEMRKVRNVLRDQGYYWPAHAKYKDDMNPFRDEAVSAATTAVDKMVERMKADQVKSVPEKAIEKKPGIVEALKQKYEDKPAIEKNKPTVQNKQEKGKVAAMAKQYEKRVKALSERSVIIRKIREPAKYQNFNTKEKKADNKPASPSESKTPTRRR